jgi:hypothetical protein
MSFGESRSSIRTPVTVKPGVMRWTLPELLRARVLAHGSGVTFGTVTFCVEVPGFPALPFPLPFPFVDAAFGLLAPGLALPFFGFGSAPFVFVGVLPPCAPRRARRARAGAWAASAAVVAVLCGIGSCSW